MTRWLEGERECFLRSLAVFIATMIMAMPGLVSAGEVVREITVKNIGSGTVDESFVLVHLGVKKGEDFNPLAVSRDIKKLLATGRFSFVTVESETVDNGLRLIYSIRNKLRMTEPVILKGVDHFRESTVRNWLELEIGDLVDDQVLGMSILRVLEEYRKDYYTDVSVEWKIREISRKEGSARVVLTVKEGKRARVKKFRILGNEKVDTKTLRRALKRHEPWDPRWLWRKRRYSEEDLEKSRQIVHDYYLENGFLDVVTDPPVIEKDDDGSLAVSIRVIEGETYRIGKVTLVGISLFPESDLMPLVRLEKGDVASMKAITRTAMVLRDYYGSRGYANTLVRRIFEPNEETRDVDIVFAFREGELVRIRNILIRGNTRTREKVIRRELLVYPGDKLNEVKVRASEGLVSNLGFFSSVRSYQVPTDIPDMKDLILEVGEKRTGHFMLGAGFSSIDKLMGFIELSQGNFDLMGWPHFTGGGQKLRLSAQFGTRRQDYKLSFVEPWFTDRPLSLGFDLYQSNINYTDYDIERAGGALTIGKRLSRANRASVQYKLERVDFSEIADTNEYTEVETGDSFYFNQEEEAIKSSIRLSFTRNTTDSPLIPSKGTRANIFGKVSGGVLNFDTDVYSIGAKARHYIPLWWGHILSFRGEYEVVEEYGDTEAVPLADRLFLGGGRTLRGFEYRDVGPKALRAIEVDGGTEEYHRPIGGRSLALASVEYTIPIVTGIRFAGFYDTGNVWSDSYYFDPSDLASSAGVGIRLDVPGFPIRIDRGWIMEKDDEFTDPEEWVFWIGYDY